MNEAIKVMLVDDQQLVRSGLAMLVGSQPDMHVVGEASNGHAALDLAKQLAEQGQSPQVVLMDVRMPVMDGIEATAQLTARYPQVRIIMLTTFDIDDYVYAAVQGGASGFLLKDAPPEQLLEAVRTVWRGDAVIAPSATKRLLEHMIPHLAGGLVPQLGTDDRSGASGPTADPGTQGSHQHPHSAAIASLTAREHEIFLLMAAGLSNGEIVEELVVSGATVKTHVSHVLAKLGARDRVQAVIMAYEAGLVGSSHTSG
ncbi:response regulator [Rothia nasisuis]|uniref:response regulator n=1 Tax=Rothia nasisuis TaxID=2109647 RepID=UPI001F2B07B6|nr:response regulator transcription factor [Rothia nasisuis]